MTWVTGMTRMPGTNGMTMVTGMTRMPGTTRVTRMNWMTRMTRVTGMKYDWDDQGDWDD